MPRSSPHLPREREQIADLKARLESLHRGGTTLPLPYSKRFPSLRLGMGDDCAILRAPPGHEIVLTTDFSLETVHFHRDWHSPESAGHRCLARGLSDLAAMGASPLAAFLSLALPRELLRRKGRSSWRDRFLDGLLALAAKYNVPLAGGDTARSPIQPDSAKGSRVTGLALADIVLTGSAPRNRALLRSGAKAGDRIYVTGYLGGAAAELAKLEEHPRQFRSCTVAESGQPNPHPHLFPEPRLAVGAWLLKNRLATAAIDISDGLSTDLDHLCRESGVAATIRTAAVPLHPLAERTTGLLKSLHLALHGGEDYELLFTAAPKVRVPRSIASVPISCIGTMHRYDSKAARVTLIEAINGREIERPLPVGGWEH